MVAVALDQVIRSLPPGGEVEFTLGNIPLDELLVTLHETRFAGTVDIGQAADLDDIVFRDGQIVAVTPPSAAHMRLLVDTLISRHLMSGEAIRDQLQADPTMDGNALEDRLLFLGLLSEDALAELRADLIRQRLFEVYDRGDQPVLLRQGLDRVDCGFALNINPLPAVAFGIVNRANPARRRAMLAFAAEKRVSMECAYDLRRNRYGLPAALLRGVEMLNGPGVQFGPVACLPGLSQDQTAGVLLLFQRVGLLRFGEITRPPVIDPLSPDTLTDEVAVQ